MSTNTACDRLARHERGRARCGRSRDRKRVSSASNYSSPRSALRRYGSASGSGRRPPSSPRSAAFPPRISCATTPSVAAGGATSPVPGRALDTARVRVLGWTYPTLPGTHADDGRTRAGAGRGARSARHRCAARARRRVLWRHGRARARTAVTTSPGTLVAISAAHCAHPLATGWRAIQRRIVRLGSRTAPPAMRWCWRAHWR